MKICVFDTETTSLEKPFCYNVGFVLYDTETAEILHKAEFCIEQIWHNAELFSSAYYAEKRPIYVNRMRAKKIRLEKWGYVTQYMSRLFRLFDIDCAFAYNGGFDEKVFNFNCDWFKTINPFDNIPIYDIRGYAHKFICFTDEYKKFCEDNDLYTETGNYSTTAEALFRFISKDTAFEEEHTALADSEIELEILKICLTKGAVCGTDYKAYRSVPRVINRILHLTDTEGEEYEFPFQKIRINKDKTEIKLT